MDLTRVRKIYTTCDYHQANMLLRCNWVLLEVKDSRYILGQIEKFQCPRCSSEINYEDVHISSWEGLHIVECPQCGEDKIPYGITLDEYFVDRKTEFSDE